MTFKTREIFFQLFTLTKSPIFLHLKIFLVVFLGIWSGADKCNPVVPDVFWSAPNWVESLVLWCGWVEFIVGIIGKHDKVGDSLSIIIITSNFSKLETGKKCSVSFFQNRLGQSGRQRSISARFARTFNLLWSFQGTWNLRLPQQQGHTNYPRIKVIGSTSNFYNFGHFGWSSLIFPIIIITSHFLLPRN